MTYAWIPGAERVQAPADGGRLQGGAPRAVWLMLWADPALVSACSAAERLIQLGRPSHLVWNPVTGDLAQLIPVVRAARGLGWGNGRGPASPPASTGAGPASPPAGTGAGPAMPSARDGLAAVNTEGRICAQIMVIGKAWAPFTDGPLVGVQAIVSWLDSWQVPRSWPAGHPPPLRVVVGPAQQSRRNWARGGHFGASQVPGSACASPGAIDTGLLTGQASPAAQAGCPAAPAGCPPAAPAGAGRPGGPARIPAMTAQPRLTIARSAAP